MSPSTELDKLIARAQAAYDFDWEDEQDRADWFQAEAESLAAKIDEAVAHLTGSQQ